MASFEYDVPDELMDELKKLGDAAEQIASRMINGATPILEKQVKLESEKHRVSKDMYNSIKSTKAGPHKSGGYYAIVRPTGSDSKGVRNMEKMAYLEYGTSRQAATPVLTKAINDSEKEVLGTMQAIFDREVGK